MRVTVHQPTGDHHQTHAAQWSPPALFVDVFDGGPNTIVRYRLKDRDPVSMKQRIQNDPFMERLYHRNKGTDEAVSEPEPPSHLWRVPIQENLPPGTHTVTVTSTNEFGGVTTT